MSLIEAFTNPLAYLNQGADAAGQLVRGATSQIGNEIDEFVTGALRNNLLGLPLDLAALNIARGRDTGVAPLNLVRNQIFTELNTGGTQDTTLKPYASWDEFGQFLKHPASLINFVAAYGTHANITGATTLAAKRAAALDSGRECRYWQRQLRPGRLRLHAQPGCLRQRRPWCRRRRPHEHGR